LTDEQFNRGESRAFQTEHEQIVEPAQAWQAPVITRFALTRTFGTAGSANDGIHVSTTNG
jgi:hypothetical protein